MRALAIIALILLGGAFLAVFIFMVMEASHLDDDDWPNETDVR